MEMKVCSVLDDKLLVKNNSFNIIGEYPNYNISPDVNGNDRIITIHIKGDSIIAGTLNGFEIAKGDAKKDVSDIIQNALIHLSSAGGGKLIFKKGTYVNNTPTYLSVASDVTVEGEGATTILNNIGIHIGSSSNVTIRNIRFIGDAYYAVWIAEGANNTTLENLSASLSQNSLVAFMQQAKNGVINNTRFINCRVVDSGGFGFMNDGIGTPKLINNSIYINCEAVRCGHDIRHIEWITGFDIAENCDIENIYLINCTADQNWESGFHAEGLPIKKNITLIKCKSTNNGRSKPAPTFGAGYLLSSGMRAIDCESSNNFIGYFVANEKNENLLLENCSDDMSNQALFVYGDLGKVFINNLALSRSRLEGVSALNCANIFGKNIEIIDPNGNPQHGACNSFRACHDSEFNIFCSGGNQSTFLISQDCSDMTFSGNLNTDADQAIKIERGLNIQIDSLNINSTGIAGIRALSTNAMVTNTSIESSNGSSLLYGILVDDPMNSKVIVDKNTVNASNGVKIPFSGCKFKINWGTASISAGTSSIEVIHDLVLKPRYVHLEGQNDGVSLLLWSPVGNGEKSFMISNVDIKGDPKNTDKDQKVFWKAST